MTVEDWRDADPASVAALYAAEQDRWRADLGWDTEASWAIVEEGRARGHVPGFLLRDRDGRVLGWTYYICHNGSLQIGGLTGARAAAVRALLDRVLDSPEASLASSVSAFVFPAPPVLISALRRRRFAVRPSLYLSRDLLHRDEPAARDRAGEVAGFRLRPLTDRDVFPAVRLLAHAYEGVSGAECFAPTGRLEEWVRYLRQLIDSPACGHFHREASFVAEHAAEGRLDGLVLTTALSADTAHVAQLVVGRAARGLGVGDALLTLACRAAIESGRRTMTLMVDEENVAARRVYERQRFSIRSVFVYAHRRGQVRRPVFPSTLRRAG